MTDDHACNLLRKLGRPSREEADRLTDKVLDTATTVFAQKGYGAASIGSIAGKAGVGKHTIYRRYKDKAALFRACMERQADHIMHGRDGDADRSGDVLERLRAVAERAAHTATNPEMVSLYRMVMAEAVRFPELAALFADTENDRLLQECAKLIREGQDAGVFRGEDTLFLASMFLEMTAGTLLHQALAGVHIDAAMAQQTVERAWSVFLHGIAER